MQPRILRATRTGTRVNRHACPAKDFCLGRYFAHCCGGLGHSRFEFKGGGGDLRDDGQFGSVMTMLHAVAGNYPLDPVIVGSSAAMEHAVSVATRVATSNVKVLITGESGVGKDVFARMVHSRSARSAERFVALNCAGIAETLLESELFGHVKGSFTGAYRDKIRCFEQAHRGTIFLDEIGDMGLRMQAMLLRFLETGELQRVGSDSPSTRVDVRIVSATNRDLRSMVNKGLFRDDLLYRIDVTRIEVPPLRERSQDIPELAYHLMAKCGGSLTFSDAAMRLLESYRWPGNVRELQNVVEQLVSLVSGRPVEPADLPRTIVASHRDYKHVMQDRRRSIAADLYDGLT